MSPSELFIKRPVATTLLMLTILLLGMISYKLLPVSDLPNVDNPTIQVSAGLPGASPETVAATIATPLEKEFSTIAGVDSMVSTSTQGQASITVTFSLDRELDAAAADVQAAIARAQRKLPRDMPSPPSYRKTNPAMAPIFWIAMTSKSLPMSQLDNFGQNLLAQQISMLDGVAQVQVNGSQKYAVRVQVDPSQLSYRQLSLGEVASAIDSQNVNTPVGSLNGAFISTNLQTNGQLTQASDFRPMIVAYRNGQPVRLGEVALVRDSVENNRVAAWYATKDSMDRSIVLSVQRQPGTNTVAVADSIRKLLPTFQAKLPADVKLNILRDGSTSIRNSAHDVQFTLLLTLALVVMVIFLFLRNLSATVIPSLALPMSIIGAFAGMYLLHYSLDNLSLMALTLAVGFVVDDAIVMLENIVRHMEMGKGRMQAALDGAKEIGFTIISMTLSLAAVFIPFLLMGGLMGRLFREFAVTIGLAVMISGVVSLTLTPMLCARFLKDQSHRRHNAAYRAIEACFQGLLAGYALGLRFALRAKWLMLGIAAAVLVGTVVLYVAIPKGFIPSEDRDQIMISTEGAQEVSFQAMADNQLALTQALRENPNVESFMCSVGVNSGRFFVVLKPKLKRTLSADEVIAQLRPQLNALPGIRCYPVNPPVINLNTGGSARSQYQLTLQGSDTDELFLAAENVEKKMRTMPQLQDISSDLQLKNPQLRLDVDRDAASVRHVTQQAISDSLYLAFGQKQVSTIYTADDQYSVIMELEPRYQADPSALNLMYVKSLGDQLVPLKTLTRFVPDVGPLSINHTGQILSVTVSFNLTPGVALSQAMDLVNQEATAGLPNGVVATFRGSAQAFQDSLKSMGILLALAVVVIYVVLGILYESFLHPLTILSALPLAGFGALLTLWVFHAELTIYAWVGIIMLVGLVKKNGIMMVDFAIEAQNGGKSPREAIYEACLVRFRPITMTTVAALMAGIPIAVGYGAGGEARQPLGLAVVGGLLFSQTLTLFITPVIYLAMERVRRNLGGKEVAVPAAGAGLAAVPEAAQADSR